MKLLSGLTILGGLLVLAVEIGPVGVAAFVVLLIFLWRLG